MDGGENVRRSTVDDEITLKLKIYRGLGIDIEDGKSEAGGDFKKAVVRNHRKGDVHIVNLDNKFSRFFYANFLWETL